MNYDPNNDPVLIVSLLAFGIAVGWLTAMLFSGFLKWRARRRKFEEFIKRKPNSSN